MSRAEMKTKTKPQYSVRRVHLGRTAQLDALAHACGQVYSHTLLFFWRTVRHKGLWLKPKHLMRLISTDPDHLLHAHTVDATIQAFFAGLSSWRERRKTDLAARPPRHRKWYFRIEYKSSAIALKDSLLILSNGRENAPLVLFWEWDLPQTVVIHWMGSAYEAIATYQIGEGLPQEEELSLQERRAEHSAGIDLGEVHLAVSYDGQRTHLLNGRVLRSKRQERNKLIARMDAKIARCKKGGKRRKKLIRAKQKRLSKLKHQIRTSSTSSPAHWSTRCTERASRSWSLAMCARSGTVWIKAPRSIRNSISGPLAAFGTSSPTKQSVWGCASCFKRRATLRAPVQCVGTVAQAHQPDACFIVPTRRAAGRGTAMEAEPRIFAPRIVANLLAAALSGPWP